MPQSPATSVPVAAAPPSVPTSGPKDEANLLCQWTGCSEKFENPEDLYVSQSCLCVFWRFLGGRRRGQTATCGLGTRSKPFLASSHWRHLPLTPLRTEPSLRHSRWPQEHQQPVPDVCVGLVPHHDRQARPHYIAHSCARPAETAQVRVLRQSLQASAGLKEARKGLGPGRSPPPAPPRARPSLLRVSFLG